MEEVFIGQLHLIAAYSEMTTYLTIRSFINARFLYTRSWSINKDILPSKSRSQDYNMEKLCSLMQRLLSLKVMSTLDQFITNLCKVANSGKRYNQNSQVSQGKFIKTH